MKTNNNLAGQHPPWLLAKFLSAGQKETRTTALLSRGKLFMPDENTCEYRVSFTSVRQPPKVGIAVAKGGWLNEPRQVQLKYI